MLGWALSSLLLTATAVGAQDSERPPPAGEYDYVSEKQPDELLPKPQLTVSRSSSVAARQEMPLQLA
jgi:hypothetical protein